MATKELQCALSPAGPWEDECGTRSAFACWSAPPYRILRDGVCPGFQAPTASSLTGHGAVMDDGLPWEDSGGGWGGGSLHEALGGMGTGEEDKRKKAAGLLQQVNSSLGSAREERGAVGGGVWKVLKDWLDQGRGGVGGVVEGGRPLPPPSGCL